MIKKWLLLKNKPISRLEYKKPYPIYAQNQLKSIPYLWPKQLKNHTLWGRTYLYSPYKEVPLRARGKEHSAIPNEVLTCHPKNQEVKKMDVFVFRDFSLNKSLDFSLLRTDCYNILPIQTRCYKNPDKPWGFLPTHQNSFKYNFSLNAFLGTQFFLIFMTDSFFTLDPILNRFVLWKIHARSSRRARHSEFYIWAKNRNVHDFHWSGMIGNMF